MKLESSGLGYKVGDEEKGEGMCFLFLGLSRVDEFGY